MYPQTVDVLNSLKPADFEGKETVEVDLHGHKHTGLSYLQVFGLPNFFFHITTAFAILRKEGVPIGKLDYLGAA